MDKAVRGLVEGRYEWIAFTSVNAVKAVREKFEEYGLDARAFWAPRSPRSATRPPPRSPPGPAGDLVPSGEQSAAGLLADWPEYDDVSTRSTGSSCRAADIATERRCGRPDRPRLGGRRRHGLPHGARRAAAGADARRDQDRQVRRRRLQRRPRRCATSSASPASRTLDGDRGHRPGDRPRPPRSTACASTSSRRSPTWTRWSRRSPTSAPRAAPRWSRPASPSPGPRSAKPPVVARRDRVIAEQADASRRDRTPGPAAPAAPHPHPAPAGAGDQRRRPAPRAAGLRARGHHRAVRSARCGRWSSTVATRCSPRSPRPPSSASAGLMLFGVTRAQGTPPAPVRSTRTACSTSPSPTSSPRSATPSRS